MNRNELIELARLRLKEAEALLATSNYSGAYYLCGYVIECGLKACIAKQTRLYDFPELKAVQEYWTHDLTRLVKAANLVDSLNQEARKDNLFESNWNTVKDWSEQSRYKKSNNAEAHSLYSAISDRSHGVLRWIEQHW
jgi:HEPN domain-containing protein